MKVQELYNWLIGNANSDMDVLLQVEGQIRPLAQTMIGSKGSVLLHAIQGPPDPPIPVKPIAMCLWCPQCGERHIDEGIWANKEHHTHSCQECGLTWRPAVINTVGVQFLPGFKNDTL